MSSQPFETIALRLNRLMAESSRRSSQLHGQFLQQRTNGLRQMQSIIEAQMGMPAQPVVISTHPSQARQALFTSQQLDEFGVGQISNCFGPAFARYDTRRIPRIPNGDLKMMSRVVEVRGNFKQPSLPAEVVVEYDVPADTWYLQDNGIDELPYSLIMEMALQPCGFLSAYMDSYALVPHTNFYFRNLDGHAKVLNRIDMRAKTLTIHARLLNNVVSGGTVIQKFGFQVAHGSLPLYEGESTFGYFSAETMAAQVGLDGGQKAACWAAANPGVTLDVIDLAPLRSAGLPHRRLALLEYISFGRSGGAYGNGYLYARRPINPQDWFYPFHFIGDPVMPGSLGVEAIMEMLKAYAIHSGVQGGLCNPRFSVSAGSPPISWRYRGQVTPQNTLMELELHVKSVESVEAGRAVCGDASVWVDGLRIYEIKQACVHLIEG